MKSKFILILCLLSIQLSYSQQQPIPKKDTITPRLVQVEKTLARLQKTNDSLNSELTYYRSKDDIVLNRLNQIEAHSDSLFSNLMTYFTCVVAVLVGVAGFITWRFYKTDLEKIRIENISTSESIQSDYNQLKERIESTFKIIQDGINSSNFLFHKQAFYYNNKNAIEKVRQLPTTPIFESLTEQFVLLTFAVNANIAADATQKEDGYNMIRVVTLNLDRLLAQYSNYIDGLLAENKARELQKFKKTIGEKYNPFIDVALKENTEDFIAVLVMIKHRTRKLLDQIKET